MSESKEHYITNKMSYENKAELLFLAKRLKDVAKDLDNLNNQEKEFVVQIAEGEAPTELTELYNALLDYLD